MFFGAGLKSFKKLRVVVRFVFGREGVQQIPARILNGRDSAKILIRDRLLNETAHMLKLADE